MKTRHFFLSMSFLLISYQSIGQAVISTKGQLASPWSPHLYLFNKPVTLTRHLSYHPPLASGNRFDVKNLRWMKDQSEEFLFPYQAQRDVWIDHYPLDHKFDASQYCHPANLYKATSVPEDLFLGAVYLVLQKLAWIY